MLCLIQIAFLNAVPCRSTYINFFDEFLYEQKQYLASADLTSPPPTGYLPFSIVNNSGFPDTEIYILILTNNFYNVITFAPNGDGLMLGTVVTPPPKTYVSASGSGTYSLNTFLNNGTYTFYLPTTVNLTSSRIYYSVGQPIDWFIPAVGPVQVPSQDFVDPTQDGYYTLFDKQEFTMVANDRFIMNPTLVDYYGLPLSFTISYLNQSVQTIAYAGLPPTLTSTQIFSNYTTAISTLPVMPGGGTQPIWSSLYFTYTNPSGGASGPLRVISPSQAILPIPPTLTPLFPIDYFLTNSYTSCDWLTTVWYNVMNTATYQTQPLYIDLSTAGPSYGVAQGTVDMSGNFNFITLTGTGAGTATLTLPLPTSSKAFFSSSLADYVPAPIITGDVNVATAIWQGLSAGIISGIIPLLNTSQTSPLSQSYIRQQSLFVNNANLCMGAVVPLYDFYSGTFISMGSGNYTKFYTTPYGDYLGTDGTITVTNIQTANAQVTTTIGSMSGIPIPNPFDDTNTYTIVFNPLPATASATFGTSPNFSSNPPVSSSGQTFINVLGSTMYLGVTYSTGSYAGQVWGVQIIPSGPAVKPTLPLGGINMVTGPVGTVTVTLGGAPP